MVLSMVRMEAGTRRVLTIAAGLAAGLTVLLWLGQLRYSWSTSEAFLYLIFMFSFTFGIIGSVMLAARRVQAGLRIIRRRRQP
jgi:hypothetical protein